MWINIRSMDGKMSSRIDSLSKLTKIEYLKIKIVEEFDVSSERIRLFFRGKQLEDEHTLFDYNVGLNDTVQLFVRLIPDENEQQPKQCDINEKNSVQEKNDTSASRVEDDKKEVTEAEIACESLYFKVGDKIDAKDIVYGAWFEAQIIDIKLKKSGKEENAAAFTQSEIKNDGFVYVVTFDGYPEEEPIGLPLHFVRPRAKSSLEFDDIELGDTVMVNYNTEEPEKNGFWYDCKVTGKQTRKVIGKELVGTLYIGVDGATLEECCIKVDDGVFSIEDTVPRLEKKTEPSLKDADNLRTAKPKCSYCRDVPSKKCKHCNCSVCGGKNEPEKQILCDECDLAYHIWCLKPPLAAIPDCDEWYCADCKNDENEVVKPGEKLKISKKKSRMASAASSSTRDWGKGMACVGRTKECTIVPPNHFGPVPAVEVGMQWKYRIQVSEVGGHRPHVAGIHGREGEGAYSLVLSGGYEDDVDEGDQFKYTGSGGRDLSGNKRTAEQSCDQTLTKTNKALATNCAAKLNATDGAKAKNWKDGKPVRVFRSMKGKKHSDYCPDEGIRYDGIYKVVKYWPERGISGFIVWKYLLRRDDAAPAPYTEIGKKRIEELGFVLQRPEGEEEPGSSECEKKKKSKKDRKRSLSESECESSQEMKKIKVAHNLSSDEDKLISADVKNEKLWNECKTAFMESGRLEFLKLMESHFSCICCQDLVVQPITTTCLHNICKPCLLRSFKAEVYNCPICRCELGKKYIMAINDALSEVLKMFFPGYDVGR